MDSAALTKFYLIVLVAVMVVAVVGGVIGYILWERGNQSTETIKIGILADLDNVQGSSVWQGAILAAEQVNAEGGVLGRKLEIVAQDSDDETLPLDPDTSANALTRLITVDQADYIIDNGFFVLPHQDICSEHKKILFSNRILDEELTKRVIEDYNRYKYYFRGGAGNVSAAILGNIDSLLSVGDYTGFNKVAFLFYDNPVARQLLSGICDSLPDHGFEIVYNNTFPMGTIDFTSYFAAIEASGAEIFYAFDPIGLALVREWYNRQSPMVLWGMIGLAQESNFWEITEGNCESVSTAGFAITAGYPLTSKTIPTREAYLERWGEGPSFYAAAAYDIVRFLLPDALTRAGTTDIEAVIEALETINVETSSARHFVYTSSHDILIGENVNDPGEDYMLVCVFQWQDGKQVPVNPKQIMEEAGATYIYPPWEGPWD